MTLSENRFHRWKALNVRSVMVTVSFDYLLDYYLVTAHNSDFSYSSSYMYISERDEALAIYENEIENIASGVNPKPYENVELHSDFI